MSLFAQPLLGDKASSMAMAEHPEKYFDFLSSAGIFHAAHSREINVFKSAIHQACNICLISGINSPDLTNGNTDTFISSALEALRHTCLQIEPDAPGHHVLVWVYFIAAAEARDASQRQFFTQRLKMVFAKTKFNNIPRALAFLESVWPHQSTSRRWIDVMQRDMPIFVI
jgi:hypothetical protein